ncbi:hypothetical protein ABPG74_013474 [Tetrahymena malaccensis]
MYKLIVFIVLVGLCSAANFICTPEMKKNKNCTKEHNPVCGIKIDSAKNYKYSSIKSTYSNKCLACAEKSVEFYAEGSCESYHKSAYFCHPSAYLLQACTLENFPVCGLFDDSVSCKKAPCGQSYSNKCLACTNQQVSYFLPGNCDEQQFYQP